MCQTKAEGGRRCAAHTRPAFTATITAINTAATDNDRAAAAESGHTAIIDHATTPSGATEVAAAVADLETRFAAHPSKNAAQEQARQQLLATFSLAQVQAEIRASVEEQVRRQARYQRTGTHAEPPVPDCPTKDTPDAETTAAASDLPTAPDTTGYDTVPTTVRHLEPGDVCGGSGFVITRRPYTSTRIRKGRLHVEGFYPGSPVRRHEWNASTTMTVLRKPQP